MESSCTGKGEVGSRTGFSVFLSSSSWASRISDGSMRGSLTANVQTRDLLRFACCFQCLGRRTQVRLQHHWRDRLIFILPSAP